jgi:hypothetical protein
MEKEFSIKTETDDSVRVETEEYIATLYFLDDNRNPVSKNKATNGMNIIEYKDGREESWPVLFTL